MSELDMMRGAIDEIDNQIVHLFERRMAVTRQVGKYKQKVSMPVLDSDRERQVLAGKAALVSDPCPVSGCLYTAPSAGLQPQSGLSGLSRGLQRAGRP